MWIMLSLQCQYPVFGYVLSSYIWKPFSKLFFSIYLVTYPIAVYFFGTSNQSFYLTPGFVFELSLAVTLFSVFFGFLVYCLVDKPIRNIEKIVLFPAKFKEI